MFKYEKSKDSPASPDPEPAVRNERPTQKSSPSLISGDLKITGDLASEGDVHIDGVVEGDIKARSVTIGDSARINGRVSGEKVRICGNLVGGVDADMVELTKTARVEGDIMHGSLQIEAGAFLEGQLRRRQSGPEGARTNGKMAPFGTNRGEEGETQPASTASVQPAYN